MTGIPGTCSRTLTEECAREAAVSAASEKLTDPSALLALTVFEELGDQRLMGLGPGPLNLPVVVDMAKRFLRIDVDDDVYRYLRVLDADQLAAWRPAKKEGGAS